MGNVTNRLITGLQGMTETITTRYDYDAMNRLTNVVQLTNDVESARAGYGYHNQGQMNLKTYGNGDRVFHTFDRESRLLTLSISNSTSEVARYGYQWDAGGNILAITNNSTNINSYLYDAAGQLTNEICFTNGLAGGTTNFWHYDEAGNWLNPSQTDTEWVYNSDNELVARSDPENETWNITVTGEVDPGNENSNKWYRTWAECRGVSRRVDGTNGTFSLPNVPLYAGENPLMVTVTDISGNSTQQVRTVFKSVTGCPEYFLYDGNGNLTNWVNGSENWMYEWDWADRLTKVTSNGITVLENWYDASARRIAKQEMVGGQTKKWLYVLDGWNIVGVMNEGGLMRESFTRGTALLGDIGTLATVTHHAGSGTTAGTYYTHHDHRGDVVLTRSGTSTVGSYSYSAFGILQTQTGTDISRFKFSSKEREPSFALYHYGERYYAPEWQRWLSREPLEEQEGFNLYHFVFNNPITWVDDFGLKPGTARPGPRPPGGGQGRGGGRPVWEYVPPQYRTPKYIPPRQSPSCIVIEMLPEQMTEEFPKWPKYEPPKRGSGSGRGGMPIYYPPPPPALPTTKCPVNCVPDITVIIIYPPPSPPPPILRPAR